MPIDPVALKTDLENNPRYHDSVVAGDNSRTLELLSEDEPGQTIFVIVAVDEVKEAIGNGIRSLTAAQIQALRFLVDSGGNTVDFSVRAIRQELAQIFSTQQPVKDRLVAVASRTRTYSEAHGGVASLDDVRAAVAQITKAHINQ